MALELATTGMGISKEAVISLSQGKIIISAAFIHLAWIDKKKRVKIYVDSEEHKIGFVFVNNGEDTRDSLALTRKTGRNNPSFQVPINKLFKKNSWVADVCREEKSASRRFFPVEETMPIIGKVWCIYLQPTFHMSCPRTKIDIPSRTNGVYRYLNSNSDIVYIGQGNIRNRLNSAERKLWDFCKIEYFECPDKINRDKWEKYYIDKYFADHNQLPPYNNQFGNDPS